MYFIPEIYVQEQHVCVCGVVTDMLCFRAHQHVGCTSHTVAGKLPPGNTPCSILSNSWYECCVYCITTGMNVVVYCKTPGMIL